MWGRARGDRLGAKFLGTKAFGAKTFEAKTFRAKIPADVPFFGVVRAEGFEPPRLSSREPKSRASANSATPARGTFGAQPIAGLTHLGPLKRIPLIRAARLISCLNRATHDKNRTEK